MKIIDNKNLINSIEESLANVMAHMENSLVAGPFAEDFVRRFCWSSNAIEGNTLSLEDTVAFVDFEEVRSGHTFGEYQDAKKLFDAICGGLVPFAKKDINEEWIKNANGTILGNDGEYRTTKVYIGSLVEAVYYPPDPERVPELMREYLSKWKTAYDGVSNVAEMFELLAKEHIEFERIHPFADGNGRAGRMVLNQRMINLGLLPIAIEPTSGYRNAFKRYDKNGDTSLMIYELCKAELAAIERVQSLVEMIS